MTVQAGFVLTWSETQIVVFSHAQAHVLTGTSDGSLIPAGQKRLTQAEPVTTETDQAKPTNREAISSSNDQIR